MRVAVGERRGARASSPRRCASGASGPRRKSWSRTHEARACGTVRNGITRCDPGTISPLPKKMVCSPMQCRKSCATRRSGPAWPPTASAQPHHRLRLYIECAPAEGRGSHALRRPAAALMRASSRSDAASTPTTKSSRRCARCSPPGSAHPGIRRFGARAADGAAVGAQVARPGVRVTRTS